MKNVILEKEYYGFEDASDLERDVKGRKNGLH